MAVEFRLLGDIEARVDGKPVEIGHARQRCVLVTLLVEANHVVSGTQLVDRVWGDHRLPARPANTLQTYMALLRRALTTSGDVAIHWRAPGYQLTVDPKTVDVLRFRELVAQARATEDDDRAADLLEEALRLWRGEPFGTLDTEWLNLVRTTLIKQRHAARLDLTDIHLRQGRQASILPELSDQAAEHPLDERLAGQLMLALYRCGRKADALRHYQEIRHRLADELGIDLSAALQKLHQQVLTADPALDPPTNGATVRTPRPVVPHQLPAPPGLFVGRSAELDRLGAALEHQGVVVISAISGAGGIGKSWLALQWAHAQVDQFPDGQLFVNLRGFDPSGEPLSPEVAVRGFLDALGVAVESIPNDLDTQTALYRSLVAGRRMLIVLDNARDSRHVEPLLPGSPSCTVLITSRRHLAGMVTAHGAQALELDVLSEREAAALLRTHLGADRTAAEPEATAELLAACAGLPLALGIVAVRAAHNPSFPLAMLAEELRESAARLDALDGGDLAASVRAVLSWSQDALETESAQTLALLGLAPGPDIGLPAAASLIGQPIPRTRAVLRDLENAHLIQQHLPGRYRMHDLIRLYAAERAKLEHPQHDRCAALYRLVDFYLHTAAAGERLLYPHRDPIELAPPEPGCQPQVLTDQANAMAWFDAEHLCLLAAQQLAAEYGRYTVVWQVPWTLSTFHRRRGHFQHQHDAWLTGLAAAEKLDDASAQVVAHRRIALACARMSRQGEGIEHLDRALALAERIGDLRGQAHTHQAFGVIWEAAGDDRPALRHLIRALRLFHIVGTPAQEAEARNGVGWHLARLGHYRAAKAQCEVALTLLRSHNHSEAIANTLDSLRYVSHQLGAHDQALDYANQALALYRTLGHAFEEANTLDHIAAEHIALDQHDAARDCWKRAQELYRGQHRIADADRIRRQLAGLGRETDAIVENGWLRIGAAADHVRVRESHSDRPGRRAAHRDH